MEANIDMVILEKLSNGSELNDKEQVVAKKLLEEAILKKHSPKTIEVTNFKATVQDDNYESEVILRADDRRHLFAFIASYQIDRKQWTTYISALDVNYFADTIEELTEKVKTGLGSFYSEKVWSTNSRDALALGVTLRDGWEICYTD